ncbi:unnamed protein product [Cuscuta epithymum]|uniref:Retroviral polymerase SH3-like domain-containing protein n=1 Tax=Cuscuta epithymum TaxID=186058 RepID=A0AAV0DES0_9ASTE|nr:unnamed protein product [Cuscuta epithymum]CAH9138337.1 unnamed protein product [Cuscuta epithymum]
MLFGKEPYYEHLRVFGCLVYAHNNKRKDKFGERGSPCIFLGYPYGQKAYKVFDLQKRNIYASRDVTFIENEFPFKMINQEGFDFGDIIDRVCQRIMGHGNTYMPADHRNSPSQDESFPRRSSYQPENSPSLEPADNLEDICGYPPTEEYTRGAQQHPGTRLPPHNSCALVCRSHGQLGTRSSRCRDDTSTDGGSGYLSPIRHQVPPHTNHIIFR